MKDKLLSFWPTQNNVDDCIRPEAESDDLSVLLAVHQPIQFQRINVSNPDRKKASTENELLEAFLTPHLPSGTMLLPIIGSSGIGKSHIVRWLHAHLLRLNDNIKRHVIRIPKSSSLKDVVTLILKDIQGSDYDDIREALSSSRDQITTERALIFLRAELLDALREKANIAEIKLREATAQGKRPDPIDRLEYELAKKEGIPSLLDDTEFQKHFVTGSLSKIVKRFVEGLAEGEDPKTQFVKEDLTFPDIALNNAGRAARNFYTNLKRNQDDKKFAIELLNDVDVLDKALNQLFQNQTNTTIKDIFLKIREKLLSENTELILLVEDFAALAGVQGALLDIVIKEGEYGGELVRCKMRTALAVTEGYPIPDTVKTRAVEYWKIEDVLDERKDVTLNHIIDFVGGYLNAARLGKSKIKHQFNYTDRSDLTNWVKNFANIEELPSDISDILDAFGKSESGIHLFPFNPNAIAQLAKDYLSTPDDLLTFNPRTVINNILRNILLNFRKDFQDSKFPTPNFLDAKLTANIQQIVFDKIQDPTKQKQFISLLYYWGGNPFHVDEMNCIPEGVYKAFDLPPTFIGTTQPGPTDPPPRPPIPPEPPKVDPNVEAINKWIKMLDRWADGADIPQTDANQLRIWIRDGVKNNMDWDQELLFPMELNHKKIYLTGARGGQPGLEPPNALIVVAPDSVHENEQQSTNLRLNLQSVIKFNIYKSWSYDKSEDDMARYVNFIETLTKQAIEYCHKNYKGICGDVLSVIAKTALIEARILNLRKAHNNDRFSNLFAMLNSDEPIHVNNKVADRWNNLQVSCLNNRKNILEFLLQNVGARQGGGNKILAVDGVRLLESLDDTFKSNWSIEGIDFDVPSEFRNIKNHLNELNNRNLQLACKDYHNYLLEWFETADLWFGENIDKTLIVGTLRDVLTKVRTAGLYKGERDYNAFRNNDIPAFRDCALSENINLLKRLKTETNLGNILSILAQIDINVITIIEQFIIKCNDFLKKANDEIDALLNITGGDIIEHIIDDIDTGLSQISTLLQKIKGEKSNDN